MSLDNPFGMHYQYGWEELSAKHHLPDWLRVVALAYGQHRANGHANFAPGDIATVLMRVDKAMGEIRKPRSDVVKRAIDTAVENGFLAVGSNARCLIVPAHVTGGLGGERDKCPVHEGARSRARERPLAAVA